MAKKTKPPAKKSAKKPAKKSSKPAPKKATKPASTKPLKKAAKPFIPAKSALIATILGADLVQFTANGHALLIGNLDKKVLTLFDLDSETQTPPLKSLPTMSAIALSADSRYLAMGTTTGILAVESTQAGKVAWKSKATGQPISELLFTLDGTLAIAAAAYQDQGDAWIRVHKTATGEEERAFDPVPGAYCCHLALSPDGFFLAHSEVRSHSVLVWHLATRQMAACIRLNPRDGRIVKLAVGHSIRQLYVAQENRITGWNGENALPLVDMAVQGVRSLALIDNSGIVVSLRSSGEEAALNLWTAETGRLRHTISVPFGQLGHLTAPPRGEFLALPGPKECWIWNAARLVP